MALWVSSANHLLSPEWLNQSLDLVMGLAVCFVLLFVVGDRRNRAMLRGLIVIIIATFWSRELGFRFLYAVLEKLVLGASLVIAVSFQLELRRFLEKLGNGEILSLFRVPHRLLPQTEGAIDQLVDAVKELSQNRTGALIVIETNRPINSQVLHNNGISLNADISKELIQTIFQKKTLLHDGAVLIKAGKIAAAGVILPLSQRTAPSQYGTRHRAAMGISEQVEDALCVVVSEETGSISLAEKGILNRFLTTTALKDQLEDRLAQNSKDPVENWGILRKIPQRLKVNLSKSLPKKAANSSTTRLSYRSGILAKIRVKLKSWFNISSSTSQDKK